jgi:hypothetical protein
MRDMATAIVDTARRMYPSGPHAQVFFDKFQVHNILLAYPLPDPRMLYPHLLSLFSCIRLWRNRLRFFWLSNVAIQYFVFLLTDCAYSSIEWPL